MPDATTPGRAVGPAARAAVLLGGAGPRRAWLILVLGVVFFHTFTLDSELVTHLELRGERALAAGRVTGVGETGAGRGATIYRVEYRYVVDGKSRDGKSFGSADVAVGSEVSVEYLVARPELSRIVGMRARTFDERAALPALLLLVGIAMALWSVRSNARALGAIADDAVSVENVLPGLYVAANGSVAVSTPALLRALVPAMAPVVVAVILIVGG